MKAKSMFVIGVLAAGLLAGCATPTPQDLQVAELGRREAALLLDSFTEAVCQKDPELLASLLPPKLPTGVEKRLKSLLERASWLELYSELSLDAEAELADVDWKEWRDGRFDIEIPGTNAFEDEFEIELTLANVEKQWYIRDCKLARPQAGDYLDPPEAVAEEVRTQVKEIIADLEAGRMGQIVYERMPNERHCHWRTPRVSWLQRLILKRSAVPVPIMDDLMTVKKLYIFEWPDADEDLPMLYVSRGRMIVGYDILYDWPEGGIDEEETLRLELTFVKTDEKWQFHMLQFSGEVIPYS